MSSQAKVPALTPRDFALCDLNYYSRWPLGIEPWGCHNRWRDAVQEVAEGDKYDGLLCLAPADHGKSSSVVVPSILWLHSRNQDARIILASNKDNFAEQLGRAWARRIEKQKVMRETFQLLKGDKWTDQEYVLQRPNWEAKDPSLLCLGVGSEIQSQRADFIFCDDIATRRNSASLSGREKIQSWFFTDLRSRLDKGGKMFVFSHRVHPEDLYSHLKDKERWLVIEDRAILNDDTKAILAPEHFTYEALSAMRTDDPLGFELFYQQQNISQGLYVTRGQVDKCKDRSLTFHNSLPTHIRAQFRWIVMALDPAFSTSKWAKYTVLTVWGVPENKQKPVLLYAFRDKTSPEHLIAIAKAKFAVYRPDFFYIESNTGQALLIPILQRDYPNDRDRIVGTPTVNPDGKLDDEIGNLLKGFHKDEPPFILPYGDITCQAFVDSFVEELVNYPNYRFSDCLMSYYLFMKGMGLCQTVKRAATILPHGIIGAVSNVIRSRYGKTS